MTPTTIYVNLNENHIDLLTALRSPDSTDTLKAFEKSIDLFESIVKKIINDDKESKIPVLPTITLVRMSGNISGPYYNLPKHTSTEELLKRVNIIIGNRLFTIDDLLELHSLKEESRNNFNFGTSNRYGGFFIFTNRL